MTDLSVNESGIAQDDKAGPTSLPRTYVRVPRKKRRKDRKDGRYLNSLQPMAKFMPFIMPQRCDACNTYADAFDVTEADILCKEMIKKGYENFSFLHLMIAAYVRTVSQKPFINRFVSGQRIYARNNIEVVMTVKKELSAESPDTCIKVVFEPDDTVEDVYLKFNAVIEQNKQSSELDSDFDKTAAKLAAIPRPILRTAVRFLDWLDYHGWLPQSLLNVSPFHGSMIITSMGSLGIKPIYHHIYNFGNLPVFIAYGVKRSATLTRRDGSQEVHKYIDIKVVTDERACDGFGYAQVFKFIKRCVEHPSVLLTRPETVYEDID